MINKVILLGNTGKEPDVRHLESGSIVAKFPLATNRSYKDKDGEWQNEPTWHDVICWNKLAERVKEMKKGTLVYVEGEIRKRTHEGDDGVKRYYTEIMAYKVRTIEKKEKVDHMPTEDDDPFKNSDSPNGLDDDMPF